MTYYTENSYCLDNIIIIVKMSRKSRDSDMSGLCGFVENYRKIE